MLTIYDECFNIGIVIKKTSKQHNSKGSIQMKLLNTQGQIQKANFACKVNTIDEISEHKIDLTERYKVTELVIMNEEEIEAFSYDMLNDWDFLKGKGGTDTTTFPESAKDKNNIFEFTEEELNEFRLGSYRECVGITTPEADAMLVIDPQGHSYARYAALV